MSSLNLGFLLANVSRQLRRNFQQRMTGMELTFDQVRVLLLISRQQGMRQIELADMLEIQPITLVHQIDQLAKKGIVERRPDPSDRRAYQLFVTDAAASHLAEIEKVGETVQREMLQGLDEQQIAQLTTVLTAMYGNLTQR